ncbi:OmpW/AlkL family protein [Hydrocarboniphaga sp.]|uniref:OmpW/AlkL family protein n=1 Tax=Hydrocarboniphaga sp. TaxID=2033016 RepID=UPI003D14BE99
MTMQYWKAFAAGVLLLPACGAFAADDSARQGSHLLQIGVFHVDTLDSSEPLETRLRPGAAALLGVQSDFVSDGTSAQVSSADTLALIYSYFLTDHLALKVEGGIPAKFKLYGNGTVAPTGPAGALINVDLGNPSFNPLAEVTQWTPVLMLSYFFRDADKAVRPYLGVGVTYTWFTDIKPDKDFETELNNKFGRTLALANLTPGATSVSAEATPDWAPVFNMGATAQLSPRWSLSGSLSLSLLSTKAKIKIDAANGDRLATSSTNLDLNPLVMALLLGYSFDL